MSMHPPTVDLSRAELAIAYEQDRLGFLMRAVERYGPVVQLGPETYLVAEPRAVMDVFRDPAQAFVAPRNLMRDRTSAADAERWMAIRHRVARVLKRDDSVEGHLAWVDQATTAMAGDWAGRDAVVSPLQDLEELTSTSFAVFAFGEGADAEIPRLAREFLDALLPVIASPFDPPPWVKKVMPSQRRARRARARLESAIDAQIGGAVPDSFVGRLLADGMSPPDIKRAVLSMVSAGTGVPAAALTWCLVELGRVARGESEARQHLAMRSYRKQPQWIVSEALRLWPPTWLNLRHTTRPVTVGNWQLPAGVAVMVSPYVTHRDPATFQEAERFLPARWDEFRPSPGAYFPYGAGSRWCLGARFAQAEMTQVVATLMAHVTVETVATDPGVDCRRTLLPQRPEIAVRASA